MRGVPHAAIRVEDLPVEQYLVGRVTEDELRMSIGARVSLLNAS
jgi:hypothetical protein